jgi:transcriptional regulator with XRE-family HTH domain
MDSASTLRRARQRARLSLRALAQRAETSHSTLAAYETGRVVPTVSTFDRILRAAGFTISTDLRPSVAPDDARARELADVLHLAAQFPARHAATLQYPILRDGTCHRT